jgi:hypothetical protein
MPIGTETPISGVAITPGGNSLRLPSGQTIDLTTGTVYTPIGNGQSSVGINGGTGEVTARTEAGPFNIDVYVGSFKH